MSDSGRQRIQQILASIGSRQAQQEPPIEALEYNWRQPHYFSGEQLRKLQSFAAKLAQNCSQKFTDIYHSSFSVKIASTTQHFAGEFAACDKIKNDYYLAFGPDKNQAFGFVGIPLKTAVIWVTQLLGDTAGESENNRDLSQLEKSLLSDIISGIAGAYAVTCENNNLYSSNKLIKGELPDKLQADQELYRITLRKLIF
jgi:flagellar motor switch protein FliM